MAKLLSGLVTVISGGGVTIGMALIFIMTIHVTIEIISRQVFGHPLVATVEIVSYYYMVAIAFVPLGYVQDKHEQIEAEAIANVVPRRFRRYTNTAGFILSMLVTTGLLYSSVKSAIRQTAYGEAVMTAYGELLTWPGRWLLPIGFAALLSVMLYQLFFRGDIAATAAETEDEIDQA